jgi:hypothetical protein
MTALVVQQQALLDALFTRSPGRVQDQLQTLLVPDATRGQAAYRAHGHALAERTLQAAYPVLAEFIGSENFGPLARELWHSHPPRCGDLGRWGEALPDLLGSLAALADEPCLPDLARVEWALHHASGAPDAFMDIPSFKRIAQEDPHGLGLRLAPGTALIVSQWPVVSLVHAHREGTPSLAHAAQRLHDGVAESALVWRQGLRPCLAACSPAEAAWLEALSTGSSLPQALSAVAGTEFDLSHWLQQAVQQGVVLGVVSLPLSNQELK